MCRRQYSRGYSSGRHYPTATEPGDRTPPGYGAAVRARVPAAQVRIGDAEREAAATELGDHFALGRLDADEFGRRLDSVFAARTGSDLDPVFADLPRGVRRRTTMRTAAGRGHVSRRPTVPPVVLLATVALVVGAIASVAGGFPPFFLFGLLWVWRGHRHAWR